MVKNLGGNKSKKQARKVVSATTITQNVRYTAEPGELYAIIEKIHGGKSCQVMCEDGVSRRCIIRRNFSNSRKGDKAIAPGTWLMVGLYDWEKRANGAQTCDILEVYSSGEKEKLKQTVNAHTLKFITVVSNAFEGNINGNEFIFSETLANIDQENSADIDISSDDDGVVIANEVANDDDSYSEYEDYDDAIDSDNEMLVMRRRDKIKPVAVQPTTKALPVVRESISDVLNMQAINVDDI
jgi:translation initiation factor IF-1